MNEEASLPPPAATALVAVAYDVAYEAKSLRDWSSLQDIFRQAASLARAAWPGEDDYTVRSALQRVAGTCGAATTAFEPAVIETDLAVRLIEAAMGSLQDVAALRRAQFRRLTSNDSRPWEAK